ncbi:MAG: zf-HC2 domain-containing protein [Oscillospiraceae bacterium]|nr:zf-HC2 domain-containing protein [Oscillospiraceae bacterium]
MRECKEYQDMISCAIDGELSANERRALSHHLERCPDCRSVYAQMQQLTTSLQQSAVEPPAALLEGVMRSIGATAPEAKKSRKKNYIRYISAAACLALVLFIGYAALHSGFGASKDAAAPESNTAFNRYTGGGESIGLYDDFADSGAVMEPSSPESPWMDYANSVEEVETTDRGLESTESSAETLYVEFEGEVYTWDGHTDTMPDFGGETLSYDVLTLPENLKTDPHRDPLLCGETLLIPDAEGGWFLFLRN